MSYATRLHHIALQSLSGDVDRTVKFYQDVFGLEIGHVWGRNSKVVLLCLGADSFLEINEDLSGNSPRSDGAWCHFCMKTSDVERTHSLALEAGGKSSHAPYLCTSEGSHPMAPVFYSGGLVGFEGEYIGLIQEDGAEKDPTLLHHVGIATPSLAKMKKFYREALALPEFRYWTGRYATSMLDLGGNCYIELMEQNIPDAPFPRGLCDHVALKSTNVAEDYANAMAAGAKDIHPPTFCDVIEAKPKPVTFNSAAFSGPMGECVSVMDPTPASA
jgi:catechol 2,3-dioxygenase-like lactoylglutathione lyase family enzyme